MERVRDLVFRGCLASSRNAVRLKSETSSVTVLIMMVTVKILAGDGHDDIKLY